MGQLSILILSSFAFLTALSFGLQRKHRRRRRRAKRLSRLDWGRVAQGLFHNPAGRGFAPEGHLGLILGEVLEELDLNYALVGLHEEGRMRVLHISTRGYVAPLPLRVGMEVEGTATYAGNFSKQTESLAIDVASLSGWRAHPACQKLGWETYLGVKRNLPNGTFLSVACFAQRPRDFLFTASEKRFLQDASAWVEQMLNREGKLNDASLALSPVSEAVSSEILERGD